MICGIVFKFVLCFFPFLFPTKKTHYIFFLLRKDAILQLFKEDMWIFVMESMTIWELFK